MNDSEIKLAVSETELRLIAEAMCGISEPEHVVMKWRVYRTPKGARMLIAWSVTAHEWRQSTPIVAIYRDLRSLRTASNRLYRLEGPPGYDVRVKGPDWRDNHDLRHFRDRADIDQFVDITDEVLAELGEEKA